MNKDNGEKTNIDISFVIIGYNEAATLPACLGSVKAAASLLGLPCEVIYVDGGSRDNSLGIAEEAGVDQVLGGDKRRKASENRNLGLHASQGKYIQFVDGDMTLAPEWPQEALGVLEATPNAAAVCGTLREANQSLIFRALEIDWAPRSGEIRHCGGTALYRREPLARLGGFPEDVAYGEEPYLCWRIRNELGMTIHQRNDIMADHDLGFRGFRDYWRRNVRVGSTYAEIAFRCARTNDRLWLKEAMVNAAWGGILTVAVVMLVAGPGWLRCAIILAVLAVLARKMWQTCGRGYPFALALVYAVHTYFVKLPLTLGQVRWAVSKFIGTS